MLLTKRLIHDRHVLRTGQVMSSLKALKYFTDLFDKDVVYGKDNRERTVALLKQFKAPLRKIPPGDLKKKPRKAAVLVPLCVVNGEASILYTVRSHSLTSHRGQVSFPGGMMDDTDQHLAHTAIREAEEELGIPQTNVDIWTVCNPISTRENVIVSPVVGNINDIVLDELTVNAKEVSSVFTLSLRHLCNPAFFHYTQYRHQYITPAFLGSEHRVWGLTAAITHFVMRCLMPTMYHNHITLIKPISKTSVS